MTSREFVVKTSSAFPEIIKIKSNKTLSINNIKSYKTKKRNIPRSLGFFEKFG